MNEVGMTERCYRLCSTKRVDGAAVSFGWVFDDTGEVLEGRQFRTAQEAFDWHKKRCGGEAVPSGITLPNSSRST